MRLDLLISSLLGALVYTAKSHPSYCQLSACCCLGALGAGTLVGLQLCVLVGLQGTSGDSFPSKSDSAWGK